MKRKLIRIISVCAAVSVLMTACGEKSENDDSGDDGLVEGEVSVQTDENGEPLATYVATDAEGSVVAWDYDEEEIEALQDLINEMNKLTDKSDNN